MAKKSTQKKTLKPIPANMGSLNKFLGGKPTQEPSSSLVDIKEEGDTPILETTSSNEQNTNLESKPIVEELKKDSPSPLKTPFLTQVKKKEQKTSSPPLEEQKNYQKEGQKDVIIDSPANIPSRKPLIKNFFNSNPTPVGDLRFLVNNERQNKENQRSWHVRLLKDAGEIVVNMEKGMLLTVEYEAGENKAVAKFYDFADDSIKIWIDTTNHEPYCLHDRTIDDLMQNSQVPNHSGYSRMESVTKFDLIADQVRPMTKIYGKTPTDIGGADSIRDSLGGAWEANIRYHHNFIYDRQLIPGLMYRIQNGQVELIQTDIDVEMEKRLIEQFKSESPEIQEMAKYYNPIFSSPVPNLRRVAYDIEVEETPDGSLPEPMLAKYQIISVAFADSNGKKLVYVLDRPEMEDGGFPEDFPSEATVWFFKKEDELLLETFRVFWEYPIIVAFNSDNFDNTYLYHRARKLRIDEAANPLIVERGGGAMITRRTDFKHAVHIDIFQFFANRSIKGYAFGGAYLKNSLEDISTSLLGSGKIKHEGVLIGNMTMGDLIHYNLNDAVLTLNLTQFNQHLVLHLLVILMRITKLPLQDVFRLQISAWVRSLFYYEHRRNNYLIPRRDDMEESNEDGFSESTIEGKSFQGAYVVDPIPGIHYNVAVMDFSSLYPSIIKTRNLSYETVNCRHQECQDNLLPNTPHWACIKKMGIFAYVVGFLRDIRVKWFKPLSGDKTISADQRQAAKVMQSALKVFINGAYGVFGSEQFPLFCLPVAESTTAIGRFSIKQTIKKAEELGVQVLYGDSDSVFLAHPTKDQIEQIIKWSETTLDLDLEHEKTYQFLALSGRKKNYVGVRQGGVEVDIKGLMAKKHNTPEFIKKKFTESVEILKKIVDPESFEQSKNQLIQIVKSTIKMIGKPVDAGGFPLDDYAISVVLSKRISAYTKTMPQHVKAAKLLPANELKQMEPGSYISYIKTRTSDGVKPLVIASINDIDVAKYKELVQSTFEQVLDALGIDYEEIKGVKKLTSFFS
jgi:DNA polymerase I